MKKAKAYLANVAAPVTKWDGPTTGPKASGKKLVIYRPHRPAQRRRAGRRRRRAGSRQGARLGVRACSTARARCPARHGVDAGDRAEAGRHSHAGIDAKEQAPLFEQAAAAGIKVVGWHAGPQAGPDKDIPSVFTNVTTDPAEVARLLRVSMRSGRPRRARTAASSCSPIRSTPSPPPRPTARKAAVEGYSKLQGARSRRHADRRPLQPHGPADDVAAVEVRQEVDLLDRRQRPLLSTSRRPSLQAAGVDPATGYPQQISAGDGSVPAFKRIRDKQYQIATVAEPLNLQGWIMVDEMNRALRRRQALAASCRTCICSPPRTSTRTAARRTCSIPATAIGTNTRRSGASSSRQIGMLQSRGDASCVAPHWFAISRPA